MDYLEAYVLHYTPLTQRKKFIIKNVKNAFLRLSFVEEHDRDVLTNEQIDKVYIKSKKEWKEKSEIYNNIKSDVSPKFRELTSGEISLILKHRKALELISNSSKDYGLVLEDDVVPVFAYKQKLKLLLRRKNDWDVLFIGLGIGKKFIKNKLNKKLLIPFKNYTLPTPSTNCTEAIIFKKEAAKKILKELNKITLPMDYEYAHIFNKFKLEIKITSTPIFYQGSKSYGRLKKSIYDETVR